MIIELKFFSFFGSQFAIVCFLFYEMVLNNKMQQLISYSYQIRKCVRHIQRTQSYIYNFESTFHVQSITLSMVISSFSFSLSFCIVSDALELCFYFIFVFAVCIQDNSHYIIFTCESKMHFKLLCTHEMGPHSIKSFHRVLLLLRWIWFFFCSSSLRFFSPSSQC